ncbi:hypothetical protein B2D44_11225 [Lactobacillus hilgardii]
MRSKNWQNRIHRPIILLPTGRQPQKMVRFIIKLFLLTDSIGVGFTVANTSENLPVIWKNSQLSRKSRYQLI